MCNVVIMNHLCVRKFAALIHMAQNVSKVIILRYFAHVVKVIREDLAIHIDPRRLVVARSQYADLSLVLALQHHHPLSHSWHHRLHHPLLDALEDSPRVEQLNGALVAVVHVQDLALLPVVVSILVAFADDPN